MKMDNHRRFEAGHMSRVLISVILCVALFVTGIPVICAGDEQLTGKLVSFTGFGGAQYIKKEGYYVNIYGEDGEIAEVRYKEGGSTQRLYYLVDTETGEEQVAYCLASGLSFRNGADYGADPEHAGSFSDYFDMLPETAQKGIAYASIYGYDSEKGGLYDPGPVAGTLGTDFWMATQCVIWEYQQGIRIDAGSRRSVGLVESNNYYSMICGKPAEKCYDYLLNLIKNASSVPSFASAGQSGWDNTVLLKETGPHSGQYTAMFVSRTAVPAGDYYVTDKNGNELTYISLSVSGKVVRITSSRALDGGLDIIVRRREAEDGEGAAVFFSPGDTGQQTMLSASGRLRDPYGAYMNLKTQNDDDDHIIFRIEKSSDDGAVAGIPFVYCWMGSDQLYYDRTVYTDDGGAAEAWFSIGSNPGDISSGRKAVAVTELDSAGYDFSISGYSGNTTGSVKVYMYRMMQGDSLVWAYSTTEFDALTRSWDGDIRIGHLFNIRGNYAGDVATINVRNEAIKVSLEITKQIRAEEFIPAHGDPVFIFRITHLESGGEYYRSVVFTAADLGTGASMLTGGFEMNGIPAGTYKVEELKTLRYEPESLYVGEGGSDGGGYALFELLTDGAKGSATFVNKVVNQEKTSHTAYCENSFDLRGGQE